VEWAKTLAVQFRAEGSTDELIQGVATFDHQARAQAQETMGPSSRSSLSKVSKGKSAAAVVTSKLGVNLGINRYSPPWLDSDEVAHSVGEYVDRDEEEKDDKGVVCG